MDSDATADSENEQIVVTAQADLPQVSEKKDVSKGSGRTDLWSAEVSSTFVITKTINKTNRLISKGNRTARCLGCHSRTKVDQNLQRNASWSHT